MKKEFTDKIDGRVVSSLTLYWVRLSSRHLGVIENVWTDEAYRRQGRATRLIGKAIGYAEGIGLDCIELTVREDRTDLQEFYKKIGFYDRHNKSMRLGLTKKWKKHEGG